MLAFLPFRTPLVSLDGRFAKHILLPNRRAKVANGPFLMGFRPSSPVESRLPRDREDPCSFRTRLIDTIADSDADMPLESADQLSDNDLRFDDTQCISVGRSVGNLKPLSRVTTWPSHENEQANEGGITDELPAHMCSNLTYMASTGKDGQPRSTTEHCLGNRVILTQAEEKPGRIVHKALSDLTAYHTVLVSENDDDCEDDSDDNMEAMNMPFWNLPRPQKRPTVHTGDTIPDDMSIISDVSLIPTYSPSDVLKQQRPQHRALIKRLIRAKARAARHTMRELKRSCRDVVGNVFVEPTTPRTPQCVAVGSAF